MPNSILVDEGVGWRLRTDAVVWDRHSRGGVDCAALVVHVAWVRLRRGIEVGGLGIGACGVGCSSIDLLALAVQGSELGWAWGLFDRLMWCVCGIDWEVKGVRGLDD